jgi:hypothetical protein
MALEGHRENSEGCQNLNSERYPPSAYEFDVRRYLQSRP